MIKIVNNGNMDCHAHTLNFSDGMSSVEEMVAAAASFGIKELWLTDHSDVCYPGTSGDFRTPRYVASRWKPLQENIKVIFGVECDLLNEQGDICDTIQGKSSDHLILSVHPDEYTGIPERITEAYVNAIKRHHFRIKFIAHPCALYFGDQVNIEELVRVANEYDVPLELNCGNLTSGRTKIAKLRYLLNHAKRIYVNSDAHTLQQLRDNRREGFDFLRKEGFFI